ncbi:MULTISPECIES: patatin-like phospholipase family protein [Oceanobacillus]|uniref:Patatin-like phospholipase n=2 Tax=Oceanobacillus TaxID=182709 RepID=A0A0A1MZC9_9BACI|nr:patatin-like phospholipase family protein [Oceanobacillus oncorhynchi]MDM8099441.1 patatin-like phospholipase family protein [Oceanobacillus oncorhynchi]UUI38435.1 patatin-like phospholipase family protein [Oceanobacillus oncorhynchi]CEI84116.1 Patatin-like phospholipase [Oceanobacillus oncorhynchi]
MKIDAVFSGGGVKGFAYVGVLEAWEEKNLQVERAAGTSAGAIIAGLLAAGYHSKDIKELMKTLDVQSLADPPLLSKLLPATKWLFLYFQLGLYKGEKLEAWLGDALSKRNIYRFGDLKPGVLKVVVSDLSLGKLVVIPDDLERVYGIRPDTFSVAAAIRMSAGFPYFFMPKSIQGKNKQKSIIVDGGLLSNFPLWIFSEAEEKQVRPVIGVKLTDSSTSVEPRQIRNALNMFPSLFTTMKQAHDNRYISKHQADHIIFVPTPEQNSMNFNITEENREKLRRIGKESSEKFLRKWSG